MTEPMPRISDELKYPLDTFTRCQRCGEDSGGEIAEFRFWVEGDDNDQPTGPVFLLCQGDCKEYLEQHPRMYQQVRWGAGSPGHFSLVCGTCTFRKGTACSHPNLRTNGGTGLRVFTGSVLPMIHVSYTDGTGGYLNTTQARGCEGNPTAHSGWDEETFDKLEAKDLQD